MRFLSSLGIGAAISLAMTFVFLLTGVTWAQAVGIFLVSFLISAGVLIIFSLGSNKDDDLEDPLERELS